MIKYFMTIFTYMSEIHHLVLKLSPMISETKVHGPSSKNYF